MISERLMTLAAIAVGCAAMAAGGPPEGVTAKLTLVPHGAMSRAGYYMPQRLMLSATKPAGLVKEPAYANTPLYGALKFGSAQDNTVAVALDEAPDASTAKLYVDSNTDRDLTNDPSLDWKRNARKQVNPQTKEEIEIVMFQGAVEIKAKGSPASSVPVSLSFYRFAPAAAKQRNLPTDMLLYYRDYGREGKVSLGGKSYNVMLLDEMATGRFDKLAHAEKEPAPVRLLIDRDGDGKFIRQEQYDASQPFNIDGTTYEVETIAADGSTIKFKVSDKKVAEVAVISVGKPALAFNRPVIGGKNVNFPADYKGRVVMLDFWATWCGPCRAEIPGLVKAYEKYHSQGFDVLGISLDQANKQDVVEKFLTENKMPWPQVYDGKYWSAEVGKLYSVDSIPRAFLVDGDTGKIIAAGNSLRGEALDGTIATTLAARRK